MGMPIDKILDDVRDNVWCTMGREHLISKQDIRNIGTQYNIDGVQRHSNDAVSGLRSYRTVITILCYSIKCRG